MNNIDRSDSISKIDLKKEKNHSQLKFEDQFSSDDSVSSDNSLEDINFGDAHKNQSMLPLKKRFAFSLEDSNLNLRTRPYEQNNPWIKMQQDYIKATTEEDKKILKPEQKT